MRIHGVLRPYLMLFRSLTDRFNRVQGALQVKDVIIRSWGFHLKISHEEIHGILT